MKVAEYICPFPRVCEVEKSYVGCSLLDSLIKDILKTGSLTVEINYQSDSSVRLDQLKKLLDNLIRNLRGTVP